MYEFRCGACGERFEALVDAGTESHDCRLCGEPGAPRVMSEPAPPFRLVKTGTQYRRQDAKNRVLHEKTKSDFKQKLAKKRAAAKARKGGDG
jgi:putative FmdB family regulatory protein